MWDIAGTDWNMVAAAASAIGTGAAAWAAFASKATAEKALQLQNMMGLYESLKSCAERANGYSKGKRGADWDFHDAANIVRCMSVAMKSIQQHQQKDNFGEIRELKYFFINQLNMELFEELNYGIGPDAFFRKVEPTSTGSQVYSQWTEVIAFFNFMIVTHDDLAD